MPISLGWYDVALRLALTFVTATLIGIDRGEHRRPVGLRTTLLLSLAACVAMLEANLLLTTTGKVSDSFATMDPMRLPLGILSGVGFIGAGAILKRDDLVLGVTTAATMWFVTVMGLCFGSGQLGLGLAAFALAMLVLVVMKWIEGLLPSDAMRDRGRRWLSRTGIPRRAGDRGTKNLFLGHQLRQSRGGSQGELRIALAFATVPQRNAGVR